MSGSTISSRCAFWIVTVTADEITDSADDRLLTLFYRVVIMYSTS